MPFTLAHPAAVLPFMRGRLVPSALVAGALAPDVFFYAPRSWYPVLPSGPVTHSLTGMLTLDLVVGVVLVVLWRLVVRRPTLDLLVEPWHGAAARQTAGPVVDRRSLGRFAGSSLLVVGSVLAGTATHLLLDLFSHEPRPGAPVSVPLDSVHVLGRPFPDVAQYALSLAGLVVLGWVTWRWLRGHAEGGRLRPLRRGAVLVAATLLPLVVLGGLARVEPGHDDTTAVVADLLFGTVTTAAALLLAYAAVWWTVRCATARRSRRDDALENPGEAVSAASSSR